MSFQDVPGPSKVASMPSKARLVLFWSGVALFALFVVFNFHQVPINLWFVIEIRIPAALLIFLSAGLGASAILLLQFLRSSRKPPPPPA